MTGVKTIDELKAMADGKTIDELSVMMQALLQAKDNEMNVKLKAKDVVIDELVRDNNRLRYAYSIRRSCKMDYIRLSPMFLS